MNKRIIAAIGGIVATTAIFSALTFLSPDQEMNDESTAEPNLPITQNGIRALVDEWMNYPDDDCREQDWK